MPLETTSECQSVQNIYAIYEACRFGFTPALLRLHPYHQDLSNLFVQTGTDFARKNLWREAL